MKAVRSLVAAVALLSAFAPKLAFGYAPGPANESVTHYDRYEPVQRPDATSAENRVGKQFFLGAQPLGAAVAPIPSLGLLAGYYLNANSLLQIEGTRGHTDVFNADVIATTIGVNLKFFASNSFYVKGGAAYRSIDISTLNCTYCNDRSKGTNNIVAAEFAIGNQWQFDTFAIGCDWVGVMLPVTQISQQGGTSERMSFAERRSTDEAWNRLGKATNFSLLRFYIGASF